MQMTNLAGFQLILWNILQDYRLNPEDVFRKTGLNPAMMHKPGKRYPIRKTDALWKEAAGRIADPCFGLKVVECWHPSSLGTLGYAMLASTSLRATLERMIRFHKVVSDIRFATLREDHDAGTLVFSLTDRERDPHAPWLEDAALALVISLLRMNYQQDLMPALVTFRHTAPACSSRYFEVFRASVHFGAEEASLAIPLDIADSTLPGGNEALAAVNEQLMTGYLATLDDEQLRTKVKKIIAEHLPTGDANVETAARQLALSTRTLQRRLREKEETSFLHLLKETRRELAGQYVSDKDMDLSEVAFLLGFSELSTFSRSFKRWTGKSPFQYRQKVKM